MASKDPEKRSGNYLRIYDVVRRVPEGKVATYGQIASLAGLPGHARQVGYALHASRPEDKLPWHRIINAKGEISLRSDPGFEGLQQAMLAAEGVVPGTNGKIDLKQFRWQDEDPD